MIESPTIRKFIAQRLHQLVRALLDDRFGRVPQNITKRLRGIEDEKKLTALGVVAAKCPDLKSFREALPD